VILATGGRSLPKTGSDGHGYAIAQSLGHSVTPRILPGLVPLVLSNGHFLTRLAGVSTEATIEVRSPTGKRLVSFTGSLLCTHFGLSGPVVLDVSRHMVDARLDDPACRVVVSWLPGVTPEAVDARLRDLAATTPLRVLAERMPERLARALCESAGIEPSRSARSLTREERRSLVATATALDVPVLGPRGFSHAEVTAGGVPLSELRLETMESRVAPGLFLCGEICDVDGRIGGFNFQWAWASGFVAGLGAMGSTLE
jgi:hypothetical protein